MKKIYAMMLAVICLLSFSLCAYAQDGDVPPKGDLVTEEVITTDDGEFLKKVYVSTEEVKSARDTETCYAQTASCYIYAMDKDTRLTFPEKHPESKTTSTIIYVTSNSASDYPDMKGYRLTRATAQIDPTMTGVEFEYLTAFNHSPKVGNEPQEFNLSGSGDSVVKYLSFDGYVADVYGAAVGTYLEFDFRGESIVLDNFIFNNY